AIKQKTVTADPVTQPERQALRRPVRHGRQPAIKIYRLEILAKIKMPQMAHIAPRKRIVGMHAEKVPVLLQQRSSVLEWRTKWHHYSGIGQDLGDVAKSCNIQVVLG